ncbi:MATE family efflux transporter [Stappia sp.]|uniref:MATE family efflux transporter n=1 Tax=Stappia sp. TaxID=1870903 RepID=UPI003D123CC1
MPAGPSPENRFLTAPVGRLFTANAVPMVFVMAMSGLLNVVDAAFLGHFVGADAVAAVSVVFPPLMVTIALSTFVGGGMSSLLARHLGAGALSRAGAVFAQAHGLAIAVALALIGLFLLGGGALVHHLAGSGGAVAGMAHAYLLIMICATPIQFLLGLHADVWRNEGRLSLVALMSVGVTLANAAFNYVFIVEAGLGVAGSAWGTVLAQLLALALLAGLRLRGQARVPLSALWRHGWFAGWTGIVMLGAPMSLGFLGIALVSATVIATLPHVTGEAHLQIAAAYGIVTRILSFAFMPLMAIALAMQGIVGNNVGAGLYRRSDTVLKLAVTTAFAWCALVELACLVGARLAGYGFVADAAIAAHVAAILRPMAALYLFTGPVLVLALYFQAIGRPGPAAALTLVKPFVLCPVLVVGLAAVAGGKAMWLAFPVADALVAVMAAAIVIAALKARAQAGGLGLGPLETAT